MSVPGPAYYDARAAEFTYPAHYPYNMVHLRPRPGARMVDLGCGTGGNVIVYALRGHHMVGVEWSAGLLNVGRRWVAEHRPDLDVAWVHADVEDYEPDQPFDVAICTEVLEHCENPVAILAKAGRCAPKVYITAPAVQIGGEGHVRGVTPNDLLDWLPQAGLACKRVFTQTALTDGTGHLRTVAFAEVVQ